MRSRFLWPKVWPSAPCMSAIALRASGDFYSSAKKFGVTPSTFS
jgi:hypothetical protein